MWTNRESAGQGQGQKVVNSMKIKLDWCEGVGVTVNMNMNRMLLLVQPLQNAVVNGVLLPLLLSACLWICYIFHFISCVYV